MSIFIPSNRIRSNFLPALAGRNFSKRKVITSYESSIKNEISISDLASKLNSAKIDLQKTKIDSSKEQIDFEIGFINSDIKLNGNYNFSNSEFNLQSEFFDGNLSYKYNISTQINSKEATELEKEDILQFFNRLVSDITKIAKDKNIKLNGIVLNSEDLNELSTTSPENFKGSLLQVLSLVFTLAKMKEEQDEKQKGSYYYPERKVTENKQIKETIKNKIELKINVTGKEASKE